MSDSSRHVSSHPDSKGFASHDARLVPRPHARRARCIVSVISLAVGVWCLRAAHASDSSPVIDLIGVVQLAGDASDLSGLDKEVMPGVRENLLGSFGSGIDFLGKDDLYIACNDRGPGDGVAEYRCRVQTLRIVIDPTNDQRVRAEVVKTTLLTNSRGESLNGWSGAIDAGDASKSLRFDAEGIRASRANTYYISDEYAPSISEFDMSGRLLRQFAIPEKFAISRGARNPAEEMPPHSTSGRQANRGFEGLALMPDGETLVTCLQSPLIQDGALDEKGKRVGVNIRMLSVNTLSGTTREYVYQLGAPNLGVSEVVADIDGSLIVLERDGKGGKQAKVRSLYRVRLDGATDVSGITSLERADLPERVRPVSKSLLMDLLDPKFKLAGESMPEKIEGLAFGPTLSDGRRTLIVTTDNDLKPSRPTYIWVFGIRRQ